MVITPSRSGSALLPAWRSPPPDTGSPLLNSYVTRLGPTAQGFELRAR